MVLPIFGSCSYCLRVLFTGTVHGHCSRIDGQQLREIKCLHGINSGAF
ncbi:hypothetical protein SLEP1_g15209 [Rubroshorea leprosula]|uniref:Uncharacterized protein n=1 Tax=Rubroshorea leprosula TaxID=152421 RepID=A0AAV5ISK9_9ROSI|nr:hypothetical protein SLEP1_g15209 [Rubroshorea leprosula]